LLRDLQIIFIRKVTLPHNAKNIAALLVAQVRIVFVVHFGEKGMPGKIDKAISQPSKKRSPHSVG